MELLPNYTLYLRQQPRRASPATPAALESLAALPAPERLAFLPGLVFLERPALHRHLDHHFEPPPKKLTYENAL